MAGWSPERRLRDGALELPAGTSVRVGLGATGGLPTLRDEAGHLVSWQVQDGHLVVAAAPRHRVLTVSEAGEARYRTSEHDTTSAWARYTSEARRGHSQG